MTVKCSSLVFLAVFTSSVCAFSGCSFSGRAMIARRSANYPNQRFSAVSDLSELLKTLAETNDSLLKDPMFDILNDHLFSNIGYIVFLVIGNHIHTKKYGRNLEEYNEIRAAKGLPPFEPNTRPWFEFGSRDKSPDRSSSDEALETERQRVSDKVDYFSE